MIRTKSKVKTKHNCILSVNDKLYLQYKPCESFNGPLWHMSQQKGEEFSKKTLPSLSQIWSSHFKKKCFFGRYPKTGLQTLLICKGPFSYNILHIYLIETTKEMNTFLPCTLGKRKCISGNAYTAYLLVTLKNPPKNSYRRNWQIISWFMALIPEFDTIQFSHLWKCNLCEFIIYYFKSTFLEVIEMDNIALSQIQWNKKLLEKLQVKVRDEYRT